MRIKLALVLCLFLFSTLFGGVAVAQDSSEVTILYWQAVSILNPYLSGGTKDFDAAALIVEPLASIDPDGVIVPTLAESIPTLENGGVSEDLMSITWKLKDGVMWSDGSPLTVDDAIFTWQYCTHPEGGCSTAHYYNDIEDIEDLGDNSLKIHFSVPKPYPYNAFVSSSAPILQAAQFADCMGAQMSACTEQNFAPIGTGPFMVDEFRPNDVVTYNANPNYREEGKPHFERVVFKGGGDAESAARAVLETGEADYAWNLQISPAVLSGMEAAGQGTVVVAFSSSVERIMLNQTDVNPDNPNRSVYMDGDNPHPFLTIPEVADAMYMAIDRDIIAGQLYGAGGAPACNLVNGPPVNVSETFLGCQQDIAGANAILDEAGIIDTDGDGIREANGHPLVVQYQTSTNAVRQNTQALIKQWWGEIGIETELRNIDAAVFFGGDTASPDTYQKFYSDVQMFTSGTSGPDAETFMVRWICGAAPTPDNGWLGRNVPRHCDPEYDALYDELTRTGGIEARAELVKAMNDIIINNGVIIPLVFRGSVSAHSNTVGGVNMNGWDSEMWNVEDWYRM
ncbi:MAG: peptide ABC transporter substrate-binding protein [Chloroflexi bacterium]|nr:peptide ABC transporter substrate-binding protein [Chloroflexota bacterium]MCY3582832.1 peptide ABC transporter substrate-binding protein [Chloroflexota bacterium]MCY3715817.1 peptide ABC transporter substrate-binding protein [Chloroflexota bacterium]MDE2651902.1 peptide ABC transporter substrate-binding protein [Chloroflexota bacterium]